MFPVITSAVSLHMTTHTTCTHARHDNYITLTHSLLCVLSSKSLERRPNSAGLSGPATRGRGTFEMLIYLASSGRAAFPQEHAAQSASLKRNFTHTTAGGLAMFIG